MGRTEFQTCRLIASEPWLDRHIFNESEMARSSECTDSYAQKVLDTADIVREAMFQQLSFQGTAKPMTSIDLADSPEYVGRSTSSLWAIL
jgi:hypothetical protein